MRVAKDIFINANTTKLHQELMSNPTHVPGSEGAMIPNTLFAVELLMQMRNKKTAQRLALRPAFISSDTVTS